MKSKIISLLTVCLFIVSYACDKESYDDYFKSLTNNSSKSWLLDSISLITDGPIVQKADICSSDDSYVFDKSNVLTYDNGNTKVFSATPFNGECLEVTIQSNVSWVLEENYLDIMGKRFEIIELNEDEMVLRSLVGLNSFYSDSIILYSQMKFSAF